MRTRLLLWKQSCEILKKKKKKKFAPCFCGRRSLFQEKEKVIAIIIRIAGRQSVSITAWKAHNLFPNALWFELSTFFFSIRP